MKATTLKEKKRCQEFINTALCGKLVWRFKEAKNFIAICWSEANLLTQEKCDIA